MRQWLIYYSCKNEESGYSLVQAEDPKAAAQTFVRSHGHDHDISTVRVGPCKLLQFAEFHVENLPTAIFSNSTLD